MDDTHILAEETALDTMAHYEKLFEISRQNDRETVLKNTYKLNETLHKKDIDERLRSQFVGTTLLYIRDVLTSHGISVITDATRKKLRDYWNGFSPSQIRTGIGETLTNFLDNSDNKTEKIRLLQKNVLDDQKVKSLKTEDWVDVLDEIVGNIYSYINTDTSEGQDILNLFFIAFNKYTGKADKNQAFTPDHITNFMCQVTGVDSTKRIFDGTCGSGSFLVQAMVLELADCGYQKVTEDEKLTMREAVRKEHIYGIEIEEKAFGLSTTNMLIHGDGNSNIVNDSCFNRYQWIKDAQIDRVLMNPPYNAQKKHCKDEYVKTWGSTQKEDPSKGFHFVYEIAEQMKSGKLAVLLPMQCAISVKGDILKYKEMMLKKHHLDAVFSLPLDIFHASSGG